MSRLVDGILLTSYDDEYEYEDDNAKNNEYGGRSGEKVALKSDNVNNDDEEEAGGGGAPITAEELKNKLLLTPRRQCAVVLGRLQQRIAIAVARSGKNTSRR